MMARARSRRGVNVRRRTAVEATKGAAAVGAKKVGTSLSDRRTRRSHAYLCNFSVQPGPAFGSSDATTAGSCT